ncbi:MAG: aldehyde dehydrogenase family protein [Cyclobacteriaceae bacterium]
MAGFEEIFEQQRSMALLLRAERYGQRRKRLLKLERWILAHRKDIQHALARDLLKSKQETDLAEIYAVLTEIREARKNLKSWMEPQYIQPTFTFLGTTGYHLYEPKGVCLIISPWNYPFNLAVGPLVSAIAAGNTFILKPSEFTPETSSLIKQMVSEVFEESMGFVVEGDARMSQNLLKLPFDHIFFTGSPEVGKLVIEAAAINLSSVTLELGGKSPTIIDETADLDDAAEKISWGKWLNAGQTCVAPDYLFVHEKVYSKFISYLKVHAEKRYPEHFYTGIVNDKHHARLTHMVEDAVKKGANKVEISGTFSERKMAPTILEDLAEEMLVMKEEIFGPILPVLKYEDLDEVIDHINARPKPLSLYFFSMSRKNQEKILQTTSSGNAVINDCVLQFAHPRLSFGGIGQSGFGKSHGMDGFKAFSNKKSVLKQSTGRTLAKQLYPPYSKWKNRLINILLRYL